MQSNRLNLSRKSTDNLEIFLRVPVFALQANI